MNPPFTLKRYLLTAGSIALVLEVLFFVAWLGDRTTALWIIALFPLIGGLGIAFNLFVLGEIAFRGRSHAMRRHTSFKRQLVRVLLGTSLLLLGGQAYALLEELPLIGIWFWDVSEILSGLTKLTGFILLVFGIGELTTQISKRRQDQSVAPYH